MPWELKAILTRAVAVVFGAVMVSCLPQVNDFNSDPDNPVNNDSASETGGGSASGNNGGNNGTGGTSNPVNDCAAERYEAPSGQSCACSFGTGNGDECDPTKVTCVCDLECYGDQADCLINPDGSSSDSTVGECVVECEQEDDVSLEMMCSLDCPAPTVVVDINPVVDVAPPTIQSLVVEREAKDIAVLFGMDVSLSMANNQVASACVKENFIEAATQNGGQFSFGALTSDTEGEHAASNSTYDRNGNYIGPPGLVQLDGSCSRVLTCGPNADCNADVTQPPCDMKPQVGADLEPYEPPAPGEPDLSAERLGQILYMGEDGSPCEMTIHNIYLYFYDLETKGALDTGQARQVVIVTDEDTTCNSLGSLKACPFGTYELPTPSGFTPPTRTGNCKQDHINFFGAYFQSRNIKVNALVFFEDAVNGIRCESQSTEIEGVVTKGVAEYTGGHVASLCDCDSFASFFQDIGGSTSTLSTELCFQDSLPDPKSMQVTYLATSEIVSQAANASGDGWVLDPQLNCIVMVGSWQDKQGSFQIDFVDLNKPPVVLDPTACLPAGSVPPHSDTIEMTCEGHSGLIPQDSVNGYTIDDICFTFHGEYADVDGASCTVTYQDV